MTEQEVLIQYGKTIDLTEEETLRNRKAIESTFSYRSYSLKIALLELGSAIKDSMPKLFKE